MVEKPRRIGLFGGSFDPVHLGHLILALDIREQLDLEAIWFIPAARSPFKQRESQAPVEARVAMLESAVSGIDGLAVSPIEVERGGTSYTVDTVRNLVEAYPGHTFTFILGEDQLRNFSHWREPEALAGLLEFAVLHRGDAAFESPSDLPKGMRWRHVTARRLDISSTEIRERLQVGKPVTYFLPPGVLEIINEHKLYKKNHQQIENRAESLTTAYGSNT